MTLPRRLSWLTVAAVAAALVLALALTVADQRLAASQTVTLVAGRSEEAVPLDDPSAAVWKRSVPIEVPLSAQLSVPPMGGGARTVTARALHDGTRLYIRLEWSDDTRDVATDRVTDFSDAAAIEYPVAPGEPVPAFCMGNPDAPVNIWHWKASWQAAVESGGPVDVADAYPNMQVDLYPFEDDDAFYPSRAAGNVPARVDRTSPVDNLLAGSFGTLTAAPDQMVQGTGKWQDGKWRVVLARDFRVTGEYTQFSEGENTSIAFAVWDGAKQERDGMKSVSSFVTLDVSPELAQAKPGVGLSRGEIGLFVVVGLALLTAGLALGGWLYRQKRRA
jgi:hypothetical protein